MHFTFQSGYIQISLISLSEALSSILYIPIWLYSNKWIDRLKCTAVHLYIPIWLYSNYLRTLFGFGLIHLYIPIWLYSNRSHLFTCNTVYCLYIPIWLYSNKPFFTPSMNGFIFTFQSGYIQILISHFMSIFANILYIPIWLYSNIEIPRILLDMIELYIPIWLYSNESVAVDKTVISTFTFQSGYIQILQAEFPLYGIKSLHSNLVIFKLIVLPCICLYVVFTFQSGYIQIFSKYGRYAVGFYFTFQSGYIQIE